MPQSFAAVRVHLVFSTKLRTPVFKDPVIRSELHSYLGETCNRLECPVLRVGGVEDHVHILAGLGRTMTLAEWVKELKRVSNAWVCERLATPSFEWQAGYGAFGVSQSQVPAVIDYIDRQVEHHQLLTFQDEFRELLRRHGLEWNERYVWD